MTIPVGMAVLNLTAGADIDASGVPVEFDVSIIPVFGGDAKAITWATTGQAVWDWELERTSLDGGGISITVVHPAQDGFINGRAETIRDWPYLAKITSRRLGQTKTRLKAFTATADQTTIDLDLIADGTITAPGTGIIPDVLSIAGHTGAVTAEQLFAAIEAGVTAKIGAAPLALENVAAQGFGHSFLASNPAMTPGPGADIGGHALERVAIRSRTAAMQNLAEGGTRSDQILASIRANRAPNTRGVVFLGGGHRNDQNFYGNGTPNYATVREVFRSIFANLTARAVLGPTSTAVQYGPGWANGLSDGGASRYADLAFSGDSVWVAFSAVTGAGGTFVVKNAAGATVETITTGGYGVAFPAVKKVSGFGAGPHTVRVVVTTGAVTLAGLVIPAATPPLIVWELEPPYNPAVVTGGALANTISAAYQAATQAVLSDFDTTRIIVVDYPTDWDPAVDTTPDGVHPSASGHRKIADRAIAHMTEAGVTYMQGLNWMTGSAADPTAYTTPPVAYQAAGATAPAAPVASASTGSQIALSWTVPNDNGTTLTSFNYRYAPTGTTAWTTVDGIDPRTVSANIAGLTSAANYDAQVQAVNAVGASPWSNVATASAGTPKTIGTDSFSRADAATPGSNYVAGSASTLSNFPIIGNKLSLASATVANFYLLWGTAALSADQYAEIDVDTSPNFLHPRAVVRYATNGASFDAYYGVWNSTSAKWEIWKVVAGTPTLLNSSAVDTSPTFPYRIRLDVKGTTVRVLVNGTQGNADGVVKLSLTDSSLSAGRSMGLAIRQGVANDTANRVDNLAVGDW